MVLLYAYNLVNSITNDSLIQWNTSIPQFYPGTTDLVDFLRSYVIRSLSFGDVLTISGDFVINDSSFKIINATTSGSNVTVTLISSSVYANQSFHFRKNNAANQLIIVPFGTDQINGAGSIIVTGGGDVVTLTSNGLGEWSTAVDVVSNYDTAVDDPIESISSLINHNELAGLESGDPHGQYIRAGGRSTGQILFGGISSGESLTLRANTNDLVTGNVFVANSNQSTNANNGALVVAGGIGCSGNVNVVGVLGNGIISINQETISSTGNLILSGVLVRSNDPVEINNVATINGDLNVFGASTTGTLVAGNVRMTGNTIDTITGNLTITSFGPSILFNKGTASTSTGTGSIIVTGGIGVSGQVTAGSFVAGGLTITDNLISSNNILGITGVNGITSASIVTLTANVASTSTGTGSLVVTGGIGVSNRVTAQSFATNNTTIVGASITANVTSLTLQGTVNVRVANNTASTSTGTGALVVDGGIGANGTINASIFTNGSTTINGNVISSAAATDLVLTGSNNLVSTNNFQITITTPSSSTGTGALVVAGGAGINGAIFMNGAINGVTGIVGPAAAWTITGGANSVTTIQGQNNATGITSLILRANSGVTGTISIPGSTASTTTTTGALIVAGGIGAVGRVTAGSFVAGTVLINTVANIISNTAAFTVSSSNVMTLTGTTGLALNSTNAGTNVTVTAGNVTTNGLVNIAAVTRLIVNNLSAASATGTSALRVLGGANIEGTLIVGNATTNTTLGNSSVNANQSLTIAAGTSVIISPGNNLVTLGGASVNTNATNPTITGATNLSIIGTNGGTGGTLILRGNGTDNTGSVLISNTTIAGNNSGALVVAGGAYINEALRIGNNMTINSSGISSTGTLTLTGTSIVMNTPLVNYSGQTSFTNATASTSPTTGAVVVTGGIGIGGAIYNAGIINNSNVTSGAINSGALVVANGGAYIHESLYVSNNVFINTTGVNSAGALTLTAASNENVNFVTSGTGRVFTSSIVQVSNATPSTTSTNGALVIAGGIGCSGNSFFSGIINVTNNTDSINATTGAIVTSGGIGVAGNITCAATIISNVATLLGAIQSTSPATGTLVVTGGIGASGNLFTGGTINSAGIVTITNATASTASNNGALVVVGGIGCGGNSFFAGNNTISGIVTVNNATLSTASNNGALVVTGGIGCAGNSTFSGIITVNNATASTASNNGALVVAGGIGCSGNSTFSGAITLNVTTINGATVINNTIQSTGIVTVTNATASTASNNGALVVTGGIGCSGNSTFSGTVTFSNNIIMANDSTIDGVDVSALEARVTSLELVPTGFGKTIIVDSINGNDTTGARNGLPFQTVNAALAAAGITSGDVIYVYPGNYNASAIILPTGVSLIGISRETTQITVSSISNTALLTLNTNCSVRNITLSLTTSIVNLALTGIAINSHPAIIDSVAIIVNNASTNVATIGINSTGTYSPGNDYTYTIRNSIINASASGTGNIRGVLVAANELYISSSQIIANRITGTGSTIGAESTTPTSIIQLASCQCAGSSADISQTDGIIRLSNTILQNATSNGIAFEIINYAITYVFSDPGTIGSNAVRYFYPSGNVSTTEVSYRILKKTIIKNLVVNARIAPGNGRSSTLTLYKNNVATALTITLANTTTFAQNSIDAVSFSLGDTFAMVHTGVGNSNMADVIIQIELL